MSEPRPPMDWIGGDNPYASPLAECGPSPWAKYLRVACGVCNAFFCGQQFAFYFADAPLGGKMVNAILGALNLSAVLFLAFSAWWRRKR